MKNRDFLILLFLFRFLSAKAEIEWLNVSTNYCTVYFTDNDRQNVDEYLELFNKSHDSVAVFFNQAFKKKFDIYIYPERTSLDRRWQKAWNMPGFKSECWMVASGTAARLDIISPKMWDSLSCEHSYSEKRETQNVITHEMIHVFHGQLNASPDFSDTEGIDWFVEGLATYASGQCDNTRLKKVKEMVSDKKNPVLLEMFWKGNLKYGLSGSMVMYMYKKYGKNKIMDLLPLNKKTEILSIISATENDLINGWKNFMMDY